MDLSLDEGLLRPCAFSHATGVLQNEPYRNEKVILCANIRNSKNLGSLLCLICVLVFDSTVTMLEYVSHFLCYLAV